MKSLAELVLSLCALFEAEGRLLQENVLRTVRRALTLSLGLLFGAASLAFLVAAIYVALAVLMPRQYALGLMAFVCAGIALLLLLSARGKNAKAPTEAEEPKAQSASASPKESGLDLEEGRP